jgi:ABC-2 type transport system ATP-binding protein
VDPLPPSTGATMTDPHPPAVPPTWPPRDATMVSHDTSKSFGGLVAVSNVSFAVRPGLTALLGPNGAGKSTMLRLLSGQIAPDSGRIWVAGGDPRHDAEARGRIGLVPQQDGVFEHERALDVVTLAALLSGLDHPVDRARDVLGLVEIDPAIERPMGAFSKGMRQRVKIAQALVHDPAVLLADEPLNGLDPRQRRSMIDLFAQLAASGRTVLVSSHVLEEVERFGSDVVVIAQGRLAAQGDFRAIRTLMDDRPARVQVACEQAPRLAAALIATGVATGCTVQAEDRVEIQAPDAGRLRRELVRVCHDQGLRLHEVTPLDEDLESVFRYLVAGTSR